MEIKSKTDKDIELNHRLVSPQESHKDLNLEATIPNLRPTQFEDYPGQDRVKNTLKIYVQAATARKQALDHVLLHGPPGLGKTTLANILAHELKVPFYHTTGPAIERPGDLVGILTALEAGAILFIDEIHRLSIQVEEVLYSAMEDFHIDIIVGQGHGSRALKMPIESFTLIGATTRISLLSSPLVSRFGIQERLEFYEEQALTQIMARSATILGISVTEDGALELARRCRGTPRIANRLLKRVRDISEVRGFAEINQNAVTQALDLLEIDEMGLDKIDRGILQTIATKYNGGPVGIEALAATVGEDRSTLEEVYEPYLVYRGFLSRSPRGRFLTDFGKSHLFRF